MNNQAVPGSQPGKAALVEKSHIVCRDIQPVKVHLRSSVVDNWLDSFDQHSVAMPILLRWRPDRSRSADEDRKEL